MHETVSFIQSYYVVYISHKSELSDTFEGIGMLKERSKQNHNEKKIPSFSSVIVNI